ncbi:MAG: SDR family oxidoreductase [Paracoccaceae bacterium]
MDKKLISFGHGYSAQALSKRLLAEGWTILGTTRSTDKADDLRRQGIAPLLFSDPIPPEFADSSHILISAGPDNRGDPTLAEYAGALAEMTPEWVGYLSTTGVYGDHQGGWVDEATALTPSTKRGQARVMAESQWRATPLPLHIFRLAGIYGPGRGPFAKVRNGTARRIIKQGQVFSRIHVDDIAQVLYASMLAPNAGAIYNLCDDDPAPPQDVIAYAAKLLGLPVPPAVAYNQAEMTPMARSFYAESKRVRNDRIKDELGVTLRYPDYRTGLKAMIATE